MSTQTQLHWALWLVPIIATIGVLAGSVMVAFDKVICRNDPRPVVSILGLAVVAVVGTGTFIVLKLLSARLYA